MHYEYHPFANIFPLMEGKEFDDLVEDIKRHGQLEPIVVHENKILDGRNRFRACKKAGIAPKIEKWIKQPGSTEMSYIVSQNLHRRHLNDGQRAMIAVDIASCKLGQRHGTTDLPSGRSSLCSTKAAAKMVNVSVRSVGRAQRLRREGKPEDIAKVRSGEAKLRTVEKALPKTATRKRAPKPDPKLDKKQAVIAARTEKQRQNGLLTKGLLDALVCITSMPKPKDSVQLVRSVPQRAPSIDAKLNTATRWMVEFLAEWLESKRTAAKPEQKASVAA